jgi:tRNA dimethylallyltransferase
MLKIIYGPTAVGKTAYAIDYALKNNAEIISADSMQIYRGMDIGTAKPTAAERAQVKHYLVDVVNPDEDFSVAQFIKYCQYDMEKISAKGKNILIVGGTGLYLNALINGYNFPQIEKDDELRKELETEAKEKGLSVLHERLQKIDPESALKIHPNDEFRIVRALEIFELTGKPKSQIATKGNSILPKDFELVEIEMDRDKLYERINLRVEDMFQNGLVDEVKWLLDKYSPDLISMQALGYKEVVKYLKHELTLEECVDQVKQGTRNFAKRQLTWFRSFRSGPFQAVK